MYKLQRMMVNPSFLYSTGVRGIPASVKLPKVYRADWGAYICLRGSIDENWRSYFKSKDYSSNIRFFNDDYFLQPYSIVYDNSDNYWIYHEIIDTDNRISELIK